MKANIKSKSLQKISLNKNVKSFNNNKIKKNILKNKAKNIFMINDIVQNNKNPNEENNLIKAIKAIKANNENKLEEIIIKDKTIVNKLNSEGLSLLHILVIKKNVNLIKLLLRNGADVNIKSLNKKRTPLHLAYIYQNDESNDIINLLLNYGANNNILDCNNKKPIEYKKKLNKKKEEKGGENKLKKIKIEKERKKDGYKGNIYNLKDSKDNSFVIITMDNISYLTSDENTINPISDLTITKNNSINNSDIVNINNNILKDSLNEINNSLFDSLEITNDKDNNIIKEDNDDKYHKKLDNIIKDINLINSSENLDSLFTTLITNKRNSYINSGKIRSSLKSLKTEEKNTISSHNDYTDNSTIKINNHKKIKKISSQNSAMSTLSQTNRKNNKKSDIEINIDYNELNQNCSFLLKWLIELGLSDYYENFLNNKIYDINRLIEQMKSPKDKFNLEDIENLLNIHNPGHIFKILIKLEIDGNIIDKTISNFMEGEKDINKKLIFSSEEKIECDNWCNANNKININLCGIRNINLNFCHKNKNDLNSFLNKYNLNHLYHNFFHNGFDTINYIILQMYSSYPINDDILVNYFHIYDEEQRILVLESIKKEVNKINNFIKSDQYLLNENRDIIKYENVDFDYYENNDKINNNCFIF